MTTRIWVLCVAVGLQVACHGHDHPHAKGDHAHEGESADHAAHRDQHERAGEEEGHGHGHGGDAIGVTVYTDKLELFAEHPPAVAGQELTFLAHLTVLDGFRALEKATVALVLDGPAHAEARVDKMLRSGIFQPTMTAPAAGTYKAKLVVSRPEGEDTIEGFQIVVYPSAEAAKKAQVEQVASGPEPISFLKEQQWQVPFGTAFAEQGSLVPTIEVAGEATTPPDGQAEISAPVSGRVMAPLSGIARPGQRVQKGALLLTIAPAPSSPEGAARAELAVIESTARVESARDRLSRAERLLKDKAISAREVEEATRELRVSEQSVTAAQSARDVFRGAASGRGAGSYRVTSPMDGVVAEVHVSNGQAVTAGASLVHVVSLDELWIRAKVPEQEAPRLRDDQDAAFKLAGVDTWNPLRVAGPNASAKVVDVSRVVDPKSRTVSIIYALPGDLDVRLRVGALVRVHVPVGDRWEGVLIPESAVVSDDGRSIVYVQAEGEAFEERAVRLGPRSGSRVGITQGISAGERIVTRGANVIRLSSRTTGAPAHGHLH